MPTCNHCGEDIEFRYIDGRSTPIHVHGGWCTGLEPRPPAKGEGWFRSAEAFTDPNAICPVCGASVFYYQNSFGSRVFFDDLGWPWPKHGCTDNPASQSGRIKRPTKKQRGRAVSFANSATLYELVEIEVIQETLRAKFRNITSRLIVRTLHIPVAELQNQGWTEQDLRDAPSFIIRQHLSQTIVEFISVRKTAVGNLHVQRPGSEK